MGLARVRKPEGLKRDRKRDWKTRFESAIQIGATHKCDQRARFKSAIKRCDSQVRATGATHKCDRQVRLTSAIDRCDSQVRSIES